MNIKRPSLIRDLDNFARTGHGLVTGEPGVGKTFSILQLHDQWEAQAFPNQLVAVDQLGSATDDELRTVLGIPSKLIDHFSSYFAARGRGVVVFDGFDAARNEQARDRVLALIRAAIAASDGRWTVVVTVRQFDARRSLSLRELFRRDDAQRPYKGISLDEARHFSVPLLDERETEEAVAQIPGLSAVLDAGVAPGFRSLLRVPFNLWLVRQIFIAQESTPPLSAIASEAQLLGLYWQRRVEAGDRALEARHHLSRLTREMVASHSLAVRDDELVDPANTDAWAELLSSEVVRLVGTTHRRIAFSHNILFDYAVSVLLMDDEPRAMHDFIAAEFSRPIFLRPSIAYYYTRLWHDARPAFWSSLWVTLTSNESHVKFVGRIVPATVVASEARVIADLRPAFAELDGDVSRASELLLRVFEALGAQPRIANLELWSAAIAEAAKRPQPKFAWSVVTLASSIADHPAAATGSQIKQNLGVAGREMLKWALQQRDENRATPLSEAVGALWAVPLVARTFETGPDESERLLRRVLSLLMQPGFPINYITRLSDSVVHLFDKAPSVAGDVYRAVFGHVEESEDETSFGSAIMPLRSTRRQDFRMSEFVLAKEFGRFLEVAPSEAVEAAIDAFSEYVVRDRVQPYLREGHAVNELAYSLRFRGRDQQVVADQAFMWLDVGHPDDAFSLAKQVVDELRHKASARDDDALVRLLDVFARHASVESAWVLLLRAGAQEPRALGSRLFDLAMSPELRQHALYDLVAFVSASFPGWNVTEQTSFQASIEALYASGDDSESDAEKARGLADLLAASMPPEGVTSDILSARLQELREANAVPKPVRPFRIETTSRTYTNDDWLIDKGVDVEQPENRSALTFANELEAEVRPWQNKRPDAGDIAPIAQKLESMDEHRSGLADDVSEILATQVTAAAGLIARATGQIPATSLSVARRILLASAAVPPRGDEEQFSRAFDMPSWSPSPQTEAAQALPWLLLRAVDSEVLDAIDKLASSPEPSVRFLVATELWRLRRTVPDAFWMIVTRIVQRETSRGVLAGVLHSLGSITRDDTSRISSMLSELSRRGMAPDEHSQYSDAYVRLLAWLAFKEEDDWAVSDLDRISLNPLDNVDLVQRLVWESLTLLTPEYLDSDVRPTVLRAAAWVRKLLANTLSLAPSVIAIRNDDHIKGLYTIIDDVGSRLYFNIRKSDNSDLAPDRIAGYLVSVIPIAEDVIRFGTTGGATLLAHTAHYLMEFLHVCLSVEPRRVLRMAADVVSASEGSGYSLDSMAVKVVVEIAEELLADYRAEIAEGESLGDLVRLLDSFAVAGWPDAVRLVWRLDEIFR